MMGSVKIREEFMGRAKPFVGVKGRREGGSCGSHGSRELKEVVIHMGRPLEQCHGKLSEMAKRQKLVNR